MGKTLALSEPAAFSVTTTENEAPIRFFPLGQTGAAPGLCEVHFPGLRTFSLGLKTFDSLQISESPYPRWLGKGSRTIRNIFWTTDHQYDPSPDAFFRPSRKSPDLAKGKAVVSPTLGLLAPQPRIFGKRSSAPQAQAGILSPWGRVH